MNTITDSHSKALNYWKKCSNSYLAGAEYYQLQEDALVKLLTKIDHCDRALDIGCGDGRYTILLRNRTNSVLGIDVAPALLKQANERIIKRSLSNVSFQLNSIESLSAVTEYDLISCMGVTSGLIDETVFKQVIRDMTKALKPGGKMIIKDTLALGETVLSAVGDYVAVYRNRDFYLKTLNENGLVIDKELELSRTDTGMVNSIRLASLLK